MRPVRTAVAAAVAIAVLGGCSRGETANETLPETPPSATETSEALPPLGPPDLPMSPEAREQTEAGAAAFIRYYMDVYNAAQSSMDPTYLDQFSQDCETCDRIAAEISSDASLGYAYRGGQVSVEYLDTTEPEDMAIEAAFSMTQAPLTVVDATGQPVADLTFGERSSPGSGAILMWSQTDQTWVLNQWDVA